MRQQGHSVYPHWDGSLQLMIDIKSDGEATYAAIEAELAGHPSIMTRYVNGTVKNGPVTAVISGDALAYGSSRPRRYTVPPWAIRSRSSVAGRPGP